MNRVCIIDNCDRQRVAMFGFHTHGSMCDYHQRQLNIIEHELKRRVGTTEGASDIVRKLASVPVPNDR